MKWVNKASYLLVFVGALNWGLLGLLNYNLVESLLGTGDVTKWVYVLVGLAAVWAIYIHYVAKGK